MHHPQLMRRWITWNVFFRLQETLKGHATFRMLRDMQAADRMSPAELDQVQNERLASLIRYCQTHVPYVRDYMRQAGIQSSQIRTAGDLDRFPVIRKADIRRYRECLRSEVAGKLSSFATGGSTGEPLQFDLASRRIASRVACRERISRWWGVGVGDPEFALWGSPIELTNQDRIRQLRDRLLATRLLPAFEMNEAMISHYLDTIEHHGCVQLFGYPSAIYLLCLQGRKQNRDLRRVGIKVVFVTGEVLLPYQRQFISETLDCPVANGYGGRDSGFIAHECPHAGMHVMADAVIVEILDPNGRPVAPGKSGEIVVTDLYSHEAPFIRYATGDLGALSDRECPCGRPLPLLESIEGRSNDSVVTPDGRVINSLALVYPVREVEGIEQFKICQKAADCFHIQIVAARNFHKSAEDRIRRGWAELLRAPVHVTFEYVPELPKERSGKFRHVVSEVAPVINASLTS